MNKRIIYYISFGIFLAIILATALGTVMLPKGKAVYHLAIAKKMLDAGNTEAAIDQAERAVELSPDSFITVHNLVDAYAEAGMYDEAEAALRKLIDSSPEVPGAYLDLATLRLIDRDIEGARDAALKAVAISPNLPGNYEILGKIAWEERDMEEAEKYLTRAVELNPLSKRAFALLGIVYHRKGELEPAIENLKKAAQRQPDDAVVRAELGMCYLQQELFVHALAEFKLAVDLNPSDGNSMYNIACVYSLRGNPEPALAWLEKAVDNGFDDFEHMEKDSDLDNIRSQPGYIKLVESAFARTSPTTNPSEAAAGEIEE